MNSQEFDFESEYLSDDDVEEALDTLVFTMANAITEDDSIPSTPSCWRRRRRLMPSTEKPARK